MAYEGSGHIFGTDVIPAGKAGRGPSPASSGIAPNEWNQLQTFQLDAQRAITSADYHGGKDMAQGMPPAAPEGEARWISVGGVAHFSEDGYPYAPLRNQFDVRAYGAVGDDVADDTQAFIDAREAAKAAGGGVLVLPAGIYRLTAEFVLGVKWVDPADVYAATFNETTSCPSYDSGKHTLAQAEPIVSMQGLGGAAIHFDFAPTDETAGIYLGIAANDTQKGNPHQLFIRDIQFMGQAGLSAGVLQNPDTGTPTTSKLVGIFGPSVQAHIEGCDFRELKRGVVLASSYWSVVERCGARHVVDGFTCLQHNAGVIRDCRADYASGVAQIVSGQGVEVGLPRTEECATSFYCPQGDNITMVGGYFEAVGSGLTDYQLKLGDGTNNVAPSSIIGLHISSSHGKTALFQKTSVSLDECRFYDNGLGDTYNAKAADTNCNIKIQGGTVPFSLTSGHPEAVQYMEPLQAGGNFGFEDNVAPMGTVIRTLTATGARVRDGVHLTWTGGNFPAAGLLVHGYVSSNDTITMVATNVSGDTLSIPTMPVTALVKRIGAR